MNILPMVVSFLLIFSFAAYAMLHERVAIEKQEWGYTGFMRIERGLRTAMERRAFKNAPKKKVSSSQSKGTIKKKSTASHKSRRLKSPPSELGRLYIGALFDKSSSPGKDILYKTAANMIKSLYGNAPFYQEAKVAKLEYALLDALIKKGGSLDKIESLAALYPDDPRLAQIYYKMLKGTPLFDPEKQNGYPPLEDYLFLNNGESKAAVYFCFASKPLVQALFGEKLSEAIFTEEQLLFEKNQKLIYLSKSELEGLLSKNQSQINLAALEELLDFGKKPSPLKYLRGTDNPTSVTLKRTL